MARQEEGVARQEEGVARQEEGVARHMSFLASAAICRHGKWDINPSMFQNKTNNKNKCANNKTFTGV